MWRTKCHVSTGRLLLNADIFWQVFAAVLCAGLLLVAFVWASVNISRREQAKEPMGIYLGTMLMVFAFAGLSFYIAMGGH